MIDGSSQLVIQFYPFFTRHKFYQHVLHYFEDLPTFVKSQQTISTCNMVVMTKNFSK